MVSLAGGMPFVQALPADDVLEAVRAVLDEHGTMSLQYGGGQGHLGLRERLVALMAAEEVPGDPEDVVVTTGAQQALDLLGKIFIDPGDLIAVEAPAYVGALTAFGAYEPRYLQIEIDDDGMLVDQLEEALVARRATEVRLHLPELRESRRCDVIIRSTDAGSSGCAGRQASPSSRTTPTGCCGSRASRCPALRTLDPENVIYLGTVSKVFSPGVRVGWALAEQSRRAAPRARQGSRGPVRFVVHDADHRAVPRGRGPVASQPRRS